MRFNIGDIVKITDVTEQDRLFGVTEGSLALIRFYKGYDEYVADIIEETYDDIENYKIIKSHYYLDAYQLKLYKERNIKSILYACGVNYEVIETTCRELTDYVEGG